MFICNSFAFLALTSFQNHTAAFNYIPYNQIGLSKRFIIMLLFLFMFLFEIPRQKPNNTTLFKMDQLRTLSVHVQSSILLFPINVKDLEGLGSVGPNYNRLSHGPGILPP